jgi:hypothetical protein
MRHFSVTPLSTIKGRGSLGPRDSPVRYVDERHVLLRGMVAAGARSTTHQM